MLEPKLVHDLAGIWIQAKTLQIASVRPLGWNVSLPARLLSEGLAQGLTAPAGWIAEALS